MINFTNDELLFIKIIVEHVDQKKTASKPYNVIAEAGYKRVPKELEQIIKKLQNYTFDENG